MRSLNHEKFELILNKHRCYIIVYNFIRWKLYVKMSRVFYDSNYIQFNLHKLLFGFQLQIRHSITTLQYYIIDFECVYTPYNDPPNVIFFENF